MMKGTISLDDVIDAVRADNRALFRGSRYGPQIPHIPAWAHLPDNADWVDWYEAIIDEVWFRTSHKVFHAAIALAIEEYAETGDTMTIRNAMYRTMRDMQKQAAKVVAQVPGQPPAGGERDLRSFSLQLSASPDTGQNA